MTNTVLTADRLCAGHGGTRVVHDLDLHVDSGEIVALIGPNGAGKTTTLMTLAGVVASQSGSVAIGGVVMTSPLHIRARRGLAVVTQERSVFMGLSVRDNLRLGSGPPEDALELFPELEALQGRKAGVLSGGEQQMLTMGRALASKPKVLLVDELSIGLAPQVVSRLLDALTVAASTGVGILLVEQKLDQALAVSNRAYLMRRGHIEFEAPSADLRTRTEDVHRMYLSNS
ncbi:ABC transporter ATP-binding protein [Rhodococcus wratislaviensis]|uniref:Putative ABC transporter ATP-binding protein n=1 Tax=Rhodococcus wratislaviensis NBRC 100605 TaxID=1219028 RepID=X0RCV8_RHOWR|nr:ABC transporter ATP-binding protein [Rhodococcus wratislaviensis]GAF48880.1 putative ABC transporter ATP-binding protein [Rhodococcus wratislaviensis NBRC 100605]